MGFGAAQVASRDDKPDGGRFPWHSRAALRRILRAVATRDTCPKVPRRLTPGPKRSWLPPRPSAAI